jgi:DNA-binding NarL/FixJ family response regulator
MDHPSIALVVSRPGRLRDGWRALLLAMRQVDRVSLADDSATALRLARALVPDLVLLDVEALGSSAWALLALIQAELPECRCIVLARDSHQLAEARSAGADAALVKGLPAARLSEIVGRLIPARHRRSQQEAPAA